MDFELTEEQQMIQDAARDFAQSEIAPIAAKYDELGEFPRDSIAKAAELGFMGVEIPEQYGGAGMDAISYVLIMAEISAADAAHGTIISVNNSLYGVPLLDFGTEAQKQQFLKPVAIGEVNGAYALTEPQSGSDARAMRAALLNAWNQTPDLFASCPPGLQGCHVRRGRSLRAYRHEILDQLRTGCEIHDRFRSDRFIGWAGYGHQRFCHRYVPARVSLRKTRTKTRHPSLGYLRN